MKRDLLMMQAYIFRIHRAYRANSAAAAAAAAAAGRPVVLEGSG